MLRPYIDVAMDGFNQHPAILPNECDYAFMAYNALEPIRRSSLHECYFHVLPDNNGTIAANDTPLFKVQVPANSYLLGVSFPYVNTVTVRIAETETGNPIFEWFVRSQLLDQEYNGSGRMSLGALYLHRPRLILDGHLDVELSNLTNGALQVQLLLIFAVPKPTIQATGGDFCG